MIFHDLPDIMNSLSGESRMYLTSAQHNMFSIVLFAHWEVQDTGDDTNNLSHRT